MEATRNGIGTAIHIWIGPLGIHIFRHRGAESLGWFKRNSPIWFEWSKPLEDD